MILALRTAGIVVGMLAFAVVFMMCGEAGCSACTHACCVRGDDRSGRPRLAVSAVIARVADVLGLRAPSPAGGMSHHALLERQRPPASPGVLGAAPLRI